MAAMLAVLALIAAPVLAQVGFEISDTENETACEQEVQQAAAASSWGW